MEIKTISMKEVCQTLVNSGIKDMETAKKCIEEYGVEHYSYLFDGKINYIGFGRFSLMTM